MGDDKKISVKLMPDNKGIISSTSVEEREKYFKDNLVERLNNKIKSDWAITLEEVNYLLKPVYNAHIYVTDSGDFEKILGELVHVPEFNLDKAYKIDYSER